LLSESLYLDKIKSFKKFENHRDTLYLICP